MPDLTDREMLIRIDANVENQTKRIDALVDQVGKQNGSVAKVKTGLAVLQGQFGLARWIIGIVGLGTAGALVSIVTGFAG